jgi:hypothetical protein
VWKTLKKIDYSKSSLWNLINVPAESVRKTCSVIPFVNFVGGRGGGSAGESFGSCADFTTPPHWTEPSAKLLTNIEPSWTKLQRILLIIYAVICIRKRNTDLDMQFHTLWRRA